MATLEAKFNVCQKEIDKKKTSCAQAAVSGSADKTQKHMSFTGKNRIRRSPQQLDPTQEIRIDPGR